MNAVDTNILLYVHDPRDASKQKVAKALLTSLSDGALLWQVACEYLAASRKLEPLGFSRFRAKEDIAELQNVWSVIPPSWAVLDQATRLLDRYNLSFWDGLIVAACQVGGIRRLYSEDFDAYTAIDSLEIINPFKVRS